MKLKDLLEEAGLGDLQGQALRTLRGALDHEAAEAGGKVLGRGICETIDSLMEAHGAQLTPDQAVAAGHAVAEQIALALAAAGQTLINYAARQEAVVRAKASGNAAELKAARELRDAGTAQVKRDLAAVIPGS